MTQLHEDTVRALVAAIIMTGNRSADYAAVNAERVLAKLKETKP